MSDTARDLLIVVGIFITMFVVWIATGGPERYISQVGPYIDAPTPVGSGEGYGASSTPRGFFLGGDLPDFESYRGPTENNENIPRSQFTEGGPSFKGGPQYTEGSPAAPNQQFGATTTISNAAVTADTEFVTIQARTLLGGAERGPFPSGLFLEDDHGTRIAIPATGSRDFTLGSAPRIGQISLANGDRIHIVTGRSPIGFTFRTNICSGYLSQFQRIVPTLAKECPLPKAELASAGASCATIASSIPRCSAPADSSPLIAKGATAQCVSAIQSKLSYNGCVAAHKNDAGFDGTSWYIYLGQSKPLWTRSARITVRNASGSFGFPLSVGR